MVAQYLTKLLKTNCGEILRLQKIKFTQESLSLHLAIIDGRIHES